MRLLPLSEPNARPSLRAEMHAGQAAPKLSPLLPHVYSSPEGMSSATLAVDVTGIASFTADSLIVICRMRLAGAGRS
jgi:hypothetical protein